MDTRLQRINRGLLLLVFFFFLLGISPARSAGVWGTKPLLSYFALTASLEAPLRQGAALSTREFALVEEIARQESASLVQNRKNVQPIIDNPSLSRTEKRRLVEASGYNPRVDEIVYLTDLRLREGLAAVSYQRLVSWIERRWPVEVALHGRPHSRIAQSKPRAVRSYEIFATRYESKGGAYVVALPDKCLKFANGGLHTCDSNGYVAGSSYSVAISYKQGIGVLVGEAGPWNIEDNFWATLNDPQPRRMFADLALGMPEAQAAYFNGYNGGVDQYGRKVTAPFAIDLAFKVGDDIGLPPKKNDWITVSFLWTDDWGGKKSGSSQTGGSGSQAQTTPAAIPMIETVTPATDGSITHIVRAGETLWAVAVAYHVRTAEIQFLNNMGQTVIIYEGQKLKIKEAGPTWTPQPGTEVTVQTPLTTTVTPASTGQPATGSALPAGSATGSAAAVQSATLEPTSVEPKELATLASPSAAVEATRTRPVKKPFRLTNDNLILAGLAIVGTGLALFVLGWLFGRGKNDGNDGTE